MWKSCVLMLVKAHAKLGWTPTTSFEGLIREMVMSDMALQGNTSFRGND